MIDKFLETLVTQNNVEVAALLTVLGEATEDEYWKDSNGKTHAVQDMENDHIGNAIYYLYDKLNSNPKADREAVISQVSGTEFKYEKVTSKPTEEDELKKHELIRKQILIFSAELKRRKLLELDVVLYQNQIQNAMAKADDILSRVSSTNQLLDTSIVVDAIESNEDYVDHLRRKGVID